MFWTLITPQGVRKDTLCDECAINVINKANAMVNVLAGILGRKPMFPNSFASMAEFLVSLEAEKAVRPEVREQWQTEFESSQAGECAECHLAFDGAA